ncbi:GNAT family N-acetyltransferase [Saccharophagus degradans]|uniref:GNAT family N-acetyltransferase n=1 Tax=Saccharophagus degradans TaxID=86304 RepID=A0AAW7XC42_9GAMM|nr:GNAT family N-acetyltransferase [Saccharophagus degradans]MDO6424417.1 GNAT family N-acetyltransferase [Saccharophagus degradans]MDO6608376.1 GNAT family N-acetyltransferase [Saccharophagus degradans]
MTPPIRISNLRDYPEWLTQVSQWLHCEWMARYGEGVSAQAVDIDRRARLESLRKHLEPNALPVSFVAHQNEQPVGVVSLVRYQSEQVPNPAVWLTNLFVLPNYRKHGIGQSLLVSAQTYAKNMERGNKVVPFNAKLQLFTHDLAAYYGERGWKKNRVSILHGLRGDIMEFDLRSRS